jgi:hypothetical protein
MVECAADKCNTVRYMMYAWNEDRGHASACKVVASAHFWRFSGTNLISTDLIDYVPLITNTTVAIGNPHLFWLEACFVILLLNGSTTPTPK